MTNYFLPNRIRFYQSANTDAKTIKDDFLVRIHEFDVIMDDIRNQPMQGSVQHFLLLGRRGSGKSTLLKRIQVEIEEDAALAQKYIAINLAEEQANIFRLFDLMEEITTELEQKLEIEIKRPDINADAQEYTRNLFSIIHNTISGDGKKIVLLLDNIDRIFENIKEDAGILREILLNYDDLKIIGGSTRLTEHFWKYDMPFYEFFRVLELKPLTSAEIKSLLLNWSEKLNLPTLEEFVHTRTGQLEAVRILTDGLPRTLLFFVNVLLTSKQETGYEYLRQIMDYVTPQYQERLNNLAPAHRKIVLNLAFIWEAAGTGEIAAATQMKNNVVSAQLKELVRLNIVEIVPTQTRNNLYRLSERFFNLWLIFTQGSPRDKKRAKCLTIFLENFYDGDGLNNIALHHLRLLEQHELSPNNAALLTKVLAQSKYINSEMRDKMINTTLLLPNIDNDLLQQMPPTIAAIEKQVRELIEKKQWEKAIKKAEEIEQEDGMREYLIGEVYRVHKKNSIAISFYEKSISKDNIRTLINFKSNRLFFSKYGDVSWKQRIYSFPFRNLGVKNIVELLFSKFIIWGDSLYIDDLKFFYRFLGTNIFKESGKQFLVLCYYFSGFNKEKALIIINEEKHEYIKPLRIAINIWNGNIKEGQKETNEVISNVLSYIVEDSQIINNWNKNEHARICIYDLQYILNQLLYHFQLNYVFKEFNNIKYGHLLRILYKPLYYATAILLKVDENISLIIPPEIQGTVNEILENVKEWRKIYYGS